MKKGWLARETEICNPRAFLRTLLWRFLRGEWRKAQALKRRPPGRRIGIPLDAFPYPSPEPAQAVVELGWVERAVVQAVQTLGARNKTYAKVITDLIDTANEGRSSPPFVHILGIPPHRLPQVKWRARFAFRAHFRRALKAVVPDLDAFRELWRRIQPPITKKRGLRNLPSDS